MRIWTVLPLCILSFIHDASADEWADWSATLKEAITKTEHGKVTVIARIRDVRCPQQSTPAMRDACVAAYNVIVARYDTEIAELRLRIAAVSLPTKDRDAIVNNLLRGYDSFVSETTWMGDQFDLMFPMPKQK